MWKAAFCEVEEVFERVEEVPEVNTSGIDREIGASKGVVHGVIKEQFSEIMISKSTCFFVGLLIGKEEEVLQEEG